MNKIKILTGILIPVILYYGCNTADHSEDGHHEKHYHSVMDKVHDIGKDSVVYDDLSTQKLLDDIKLLQVDIDNEEIKPFFIGERKESLTSFPCSNCHTQPLKELQLKQNPHEKKSHWNISIAHASEETMECTTCHSEKDLNQLTSLTGAFIDLNESYKLCGQCHSTQYKDWQGGAHGKRLGGWVNPRVVKTCVGCHNPHQPAFPSRWPARLNTVKLSEE